MVKGTSIASRAGLTAPIPDFDFRVRVTPHVNWANRHMDAAGRCGRWSGALPDARTDWLSTIPRRAELYAGPRCGERIQEGRRRLGFAVDSGAVFGDRKANDGTRTVEAVNRSQVRHGREPNGIAGAEVASIHWDLGTPTAAHKYCAKRDRTDFHRVRHRPWPEPWCVRITPRSTAGGCLKGAR